MTSSGKEVDSAGSGSRVQSIFSLAQDAFYTGERREGDLTDGCSCSSHHLTPDWDSGIRESRHDKKFSLS